MVDRTCAAALLFSENSARRTTATEEGKRETEENAIELVIGDKKRNYGPRSTKTTGTRQIKLVSMKMETQCSYKGSIQQRENVLMA